MVGKRVVVKRGTSHDDGTDDDDDDAAREAESAQLAKLCCTGQLI